MQQEYIIHFNKRILNTYEEGIDYKQVSVNHELIFFCSPNLASKKTRKPAYNKKYFIVTGEAYKCMLMNSKTIKGKETRKCNTCKEVKVVSEFHKLKISLDGYRGICKECRKTSNK